MSTLASSSSVNFYNLIHFLHTNFHFESKLIEMIIMWEVLNILFDFRFIWTNHAFWLVETSKILFTETTFGMKLLLGRNVPSLKCLFLWIFCCSEIQDVHHCRTKSYKRKWNKNSQKLDIRLNKYWKLIIIDWYSTKFYFFLCWLEIQDRCHDRTNLI